MFTIEGINNWLCLPLNQTYEIGGSWDISNTYKAISINAACSNACSFSNCGTIAVYQLNSNINPNNVEKPFQQFFTRNDMNFGDKIWNYYVAHLDENRVITN